MRRANEADYQRLTDEVAASERHRALDRSAARARACQGGASGLLPGGASIRLIPAGRIGGEIRGFIDSQSPVCAAQRTHRVEGRSSRCPHRSSSNAARGDAQPAEQIDDVTPCSTTRRARAIARRCCARVWQLLDASRGAIPTGTVAILRRCSMRWLREEVEIDRRYARMTQG